MCTPGTLQAPVPCTQLAVATQALAVCEGGRGSGLLVSSLFPCTEPQPSLSGASPLVTPLESHLTG